MLKKLQILYVDDEHDITTRIKRMIERRYPVNIDTAENGRDALDKLKSKHYDALLTDVSMPVMSGFDLVAEAMLLFPKLRIAIITGSGDFEQIAKLKGALYLPKPVTIEEVGGLIYTMFGVMPIQREATLPSIETEGAS
jgi:two-component system, response regulator YesN